MKVSTSNHLKEWTKDMVHTEAVDTLVDQLSKGPSVYIVKGSPGEGKTTVAKIALKKMQDKGREVFVVNKPKEYDAVKSVKRSVILLDDVFGSLQFDLQKFLRWENVFNDHLALEEHTDKSQPSTKPTLLLVTRSSVLHSASKQLGRLHSLILKEGCVMDLTKDIKYTVEEKIQIWSHYASHYTVDIEERRVREICKKALCHGFPHCCRLFTNMYSKDRKLKMEDFFSKPLEFLQQDLKSLFDNDVAGPLLKEMLRHEGKYYMDTTPKESFHITKAIGPYEGLYFRREGELVTFHHSSIYDTVAFLACDEDPLFVIQNCSLTFLNDRIRLGRPAGFDIGQQTTVLINERYKQDFVERMKNEMEAGNISDVLSHDSFHDEGFVRELMERVLSNELNVQRLCDLVKKTDKKTGDSFLFLCSKSKSHKVLQYVCERITLSREDQTSVLFGICRHSSSASMQYFLEKYPNCDLSVQNERRETLLIVAAQNPCDEILWILINRGVRVQVEDAFGHTALYYVCRYGVEKDASIVGKMVMKGADVNTWGWIGETSLSTATKYGHNTVVTALLEIGAEINKSDIKGETPLAVACRAGYNTLVTTLLDRS